MGQITISCLDLSPPIMPQIQLLTVLGKISFLGDDKVGVSEIGRLRGLE